MIQLKIPTAEGRPFRMLCIGAHSDDIEIGCGGTLIDFFMSSPDCEVLWVVLSATSERSREAEKSAQIYLKDVMHKQILIQDFRDSYFPYQGDTLKEFFEDLKSRISPDLIFTHYRKDLHQDHRLVSELTWNTFRNHLIFEYEILKYDGDVGTPNMFVPLDNATCLEKIRRLKHCFASQESNAWFDDESFMAIMRIRGIEANSPTRYAEAFYCRKSLLDLTF